MKRKLALAFAAILLMLVALFASVPAPVPGSNIYVTMGGKVDGKIYMYVQNYLVGPNRIPWGGLALPLPFPFVTRAPLLKPMHLLENITFSNPIDVGGAPGPDIILITVKQMNPIVHIVWVAFRNAYWRFTLVAVAAGSGVIFINPYMPGDVDCYTFNNDTGVWWGPESQMAGTKAAESGGYYNNLTKDFVPSMASRFPGGGYDSIPGTRLWGDPLDGFGDGNPDPVGSSILMLPLVLMGDELNATTGLWTPKMAIPMPLVLTTGTAYDHVDQLLYWVPNPSPPPPQLPRGSFLHCTNSTEVGTPWDASYIKVTYVCAWSNLLYCLNPDDAGDGLGWEDAEAVTNAWYTVDVFYEYVETKVRQDKAFADLDLDGDVDIFDVRHVAAAFGKMDEGNVEVHPGVWELRKTADLGFDPTADLTCNGLVDIFDVRKCAKDYGKS